MERRKCLDDRGRFLLYTWRGGLTPIRDGSNAQSILKQLWDESDHPKSLGMALGHIPMCPCDAAQTRGHLVVVYMAGHFVSLAVADMICLVT